MPKIKVDPKLRQFLQSKGVWEEFKSEVIQYWNINNASIPTQIDRINRAFEWDKTTSGQRFWGGIQFEYSKYIRLNSGPLCRN